MGKKINDTINLIIIGLFVILALLYIYSTSYTTEEFLEGLKKKPKKKDFEQLKRDHDKYFNSLKKTSDALENKYSTLNKEYNEYKKNYSNTKNVEEKNKYNKLKNKHINLENEYNSFKKSFSFDRGEVNDINCNNINNEHTICQSSLSVLSNLPGGPELDNKFKSMCAPFQTRIDNCREKEKGNVSVLEEKKPKEPRKLKKQREPKKPASKRLPLKDSQNLF